MRTTILVLAIACVPVLPAGAQDRTAPQTPAPAVVAPVAAPAPADVQTIDLSSAGLRLAWPGQWRWTSSDRPICLLIGQSVGRTPWAAVLLYATRQQRDLAADADKQVALAMVQAFGKQLPEGGATSAPVEAVVRVGAVAGIRVTTVATRPNAAAETFAVTVWQHRDKPTGQLMQYALEVHVGGDAAADAARLSKQLADGITHAPLTPAGDAQPAPLARAIDLKAEGISLRLPATWCITKKGRRGGTDQVLTASLADYRGGIEPHLNLSVVEAGPSPGQRFDTREYADQVAKALETDGARFHWKRLEAGVAKFGGVSGVQVVGRATAGKRTVVQVQRQAFSHGRVYALSITMPGDDPAAAKAVMDAVAGSAEFAEPVEPSAENTKGTPE